MVEVEVGCLPSSRPEELNETSGMDVADDTQFADDLYQF